MEQRKEKKMSSKWQCIFSVWLCSSLPNLQTWVMHDQWRPNTPGMSLRLVRCCSSSRRACAMLASAWMTRRCSSILIGATVLSKIPFCSEVERWEPLNSFLVDQTIANTLSARNTHHWCIIDDFQYSRDFKSIRHVRLHNMGIQIPFRPKGMVYRC